MISYSLADAASPVLERDDDHIISIINWERPYKFGCFPSTSSNFVFTYIACSCLLPAQVKYLNDFATAYQLNIQYNTNITRVEKDSLFYLTDQEATTYTCSVVIVRLVCATTVLGCSIAIPFGVNV